MRVGLLAVPIALQTTVGPIPFAYDRSPVVMARVADGICVTYYKSVSLGIDALWAVKFHTQVPIARCKATVFRYNVRLDSLFRLGLAGAKIDAGVLRQLIDHARPEPSVVGPVDDTDELGELVVWDDRSRGWTPGPQSDFHGALRLLLTWIFEEARRHWIDAGWRPGRTENVSDTLVPTGAPGPMWLPGE